MQHHSYGRWQKYGRIRLPVYLKMKTPINWVHESLLSDTLEERMLRKRARGSKMVTNAKWHHQQDLRGLDEGSYRQQQVAENTVIKLTSGSEYTWIMVTMWHGLRIQIICRVANLKPSSMPNIRHMMAMSTRRPVLCIVDGTTGIAWSRTWG